MKKNLYILGILLISVITFSNVSAKDTILTCNYYKGYDNLGGSSQASILCQIYSDYSHQCYMEVGNKTASTSSNKESIQNWGSTVGSVGNGWKAKEYVQNSNACPEYLVFKMDSGWDGYEIHAAETKDSAISLLSELSGSRYIAESTDNRNDDDKNAAQEAIEECTTNIKKSIQNYSVAACKDDSKVATRLQECDNQFLSLRNYIDNCQINVSNYVGQNLASENDDFVVDFYSQYDSANKAMDGFTVELDEEREVIKQELGLTPSEPTTNITPNEDPSYVSGCDMLGENTIGFINKLYGYFTWIIPVLIVVLSVLDFVKVVGSGDDKDLKKAGDNLKKRIIIGVIFFLVPLIVKLFINISGVTDNFADGGNVVETITCILK